jgi:hypothetical protein
MTIHWVSTSSDDVFEALAAVDQALMQGDPGQAPAASMPAQSADQDPYLIEGVQALHGRWSIDQVAIVHSNRPGLARAINTFQQVVRKATWWYQLPQWNQVSSFHAAVVRVIDVLLDRQRLLGIRIAQLEQANTAAHIFALEQQIQALRDEQRMLRQRIAELEQRS